MQGRGLDYWAVWATIRDTLRLYVNSFEDDQELVAINLVDAFDWCVSDGALNEADRGDKLATELVRMIANAWMNALSVHANRPRNCLGQVEGRRPPRSKLALVPAVAGT